MDLPYAIDLEVDARNLRCPLPILRAKKALSSLDGGAVIKVVCTDPSSVNDFKAYCAQTKHVLLNQDIQEDEYIHYIQRRES